MRPEARGFALVVVSAVSFGGVAVLGKLALATGASVVSVLFWRWVIAAAALAPVALLLERTRPPPRALAAGVLLGLVGYVGTSGLYFLALPHVAAAVASFLLFLSPVIVAPLSALLLGERLDRRGWAALGVALGGLALLTLGPGVSASPKGVGFALAAAFAYACTIVAGRRIVAEGGPLHVSVALMVGAIAGFALAGAATGSLAPLPGARAWILVSVLAVVSTSVSIATFYAALPLVGAPRAALVSTLEPVSTLVVAAVVLGERLGPSELAGAALVVAAVVLVVRRGR